MHGTIECVLITPDPSSLRSTALTSISLTFEGIEGDVHFGITRKADGRTPWYERGTLIRNDRQVSLVSFEELAQVSARMGVNQIKPEWLGANLLVKGIPDLSQLPWKSRIVCSGGVVLSGLRENKPCIGPGKLIADEYHQPELAKLFPTAAIHLRGLVAIIEKPGEISPGDTIHIE